MQVITNEQVASLLTVKDAITVMREAFAHYATAGAMQERVRIDSGKTKLSAMGAVIPGLNAAGAKIYSTINGKFTFVIVLFAADDGRLLAVMEGDTMTEFRTAAVTAVAADKLARQDATTLAIFGTGIQARAHVPALLAVRNFSEVLVVGIEGQDAFAQHIATQYGIPARATTAAEAASQADVILTATRSASPLFDGNDIKPGAFVAAIGSSKPDTREVDDTLIRRASKIVVEWKKQAAYEAGDLLLCDKNSFAWDDVLEMTDVVQGAGIRSNESDIILYKAIGVGVEDVALAEFVYRKLAG
ncbi:ornithine cyclodeaminase [Undibacterium sp. KW1]|uniref:ornithine cyclodeaminase family protein n=1 Tax=Undibacterium sp. KW1 TaxID=2058624 RepID=UPI001331C812|nr:ornithine cyclodeaminase family protein [Undibacterium sp. KW1]BBB62488.1 ornithine cyclodeaminase [Undibacterium sp. KW1]